MNSITKIISASGCLFR